MEARAELRETRSRPVDPMQIRQGVHQHLADPAFHVFVIRERRRHLVPDDHAVTTLHDLKGGADDRFVLTVEIALGGECEVVTQLREHPVLPLHVV